VGTYAILGALAATLLAVVLVVMAGNSVADRKTELAKLEREKATAQAKLTKLGSYTQFKDVQARRMATVTALAKSRFDWERVMRELSLVLPKGVWLTGLKATVRPDVQVANGPQNTLRQQISGPALELTGCGRSHETVAVFLTRLPS
jgi:Tfp pilus assembly protein PilN